jgi:hypothetical protein
LKEEEEEEEEEDALRSPKDAYPLSMSAIARPPRVSDPVNSPVNCSISLRSIVLPDRG